jgi:hypothetical protein
MVTRGFIGIVIDGTEKIGYNCFDSYPSGLGVAVLRFAASVDATTRGLARSLQVVTDDDMPAVEDVERLAPYTNTNVGGRTTTPDWYQLLRGTQGDMAAILRAGAIQDAHNFPCDSLFAEWGYLIDLDTQTFEAYQGFQHEPHDKGRFADRGGVKDGYYPCALRASWPLEKLPSEKEFLAAMGEDEEE